MGLFVRPAAACAAATLIAFACGSGFAADDAGAVRLLVSPVVVAAPRLDPRAGAPQALADEMETAVRAAYPGRAERLDRAGALAPSERAVVLVPRLGAERVSHDVVAGSIHVFDATVVGDVSAFDPWTETLLYAATRCVSARVEVGASRLAEADEAIRRAFKEAQASWVKSVVAQLAKDLQPYVLVAETVAPPEGEALQGGVWPLGALRGVARGALAVSEDGRRARVEMTAPRFALLRDVGDEDRAIPAGERWRLVVVAQPTERREPLVEVRWMPGAPRRPADAAIDADGALDIFEDYLSKDGNPRLLPQAPHDEDAARQWRSVVDAVARNATLVRSGRLTVHQQTLVRAAQENPDLTIDLAELERWSGRRAGKDNESERWFRLRLGATVSLTAGEGASGCGEVAKTVAVVEERAVVEQPGVREVDVAALWFSLERNALIKLAERVREALGPLVGPLGDLATGRVDRAGRVEWERGRAPGRSTPLAWYRPRGTVRGRDGIELGRLLQPMQPKLGFLNLSVLVKERVAAGDELQYRAAGAEKPRSLFRADASYEGAPWLYPAEWLVRCAAARFGEAFGVAAVVCGPRSAALGLPTLALEVSGVSRESDGRRTALRGTWRLRAYPSGAGAGVEPEFRFGVQFDQSSDGGEGAPFDVADDGRAVAAFVDGAFDRLQERAVERQFSSYLGGIPGKE